MEQNVIGKVDLHLHAVINGIISDLSYSAQHYLVVAHYSFYFDKLSNFAPVYLHRESIDEILLTEDGLKCKFTFETEDEDGHYTINIRYDQIGRISKCDHADFVDEDILFFNEDVMLKHYYTSGTFGFYAN